MRTPAQFVENLGKVRDVLFKVLSICRRLGQSCCFCARDSPVAFILAVTVVCAILAVVLAFNLCLVRLFTTPGAILVNLGMLWMVLRFIVRALVFPGSILFWRRNTEATYRIEISRSFSTHLRHVQTFLSLATDPRENGSSVNPTSLSVESVALGCIVIQGLAQNFRLQQHDKVCFTTEKDRVKTLVHHVESYLKSAKVLETQLGEKGGEVALLDWLKRISGKLAPVPLSIALATAHLEPYTRRDGAYCLTMLEELTAIFEELQRPKENCCSNSVRFLREPTVGSLHQLRAELKTRYTGTHHWVPARCGCKLDAMLIRCRSLESGACPPPRADEAFSFQEQAPLKDFVDADDCAREPVIIWCNANAAYYETMAYESTWLDFYLSRGCSILLFNYSGFGRSQGNPTPAALAADGSAVIAFLQRRGYQQIGLHGRSIGGIAACSLAKLHPDVVKILIADRTFSTLASAAKFTFGDWAVTGLSLSATKADNLANYAQARCYKVAICDPHDATIPDLASLRTGIAIRALEQCAPGERLELPEEQVRRLASAWQFLQTLLAICDREKGQLIGRAPLRSQPPSPPQQQETKRSARPVTFGRPGDGEDHADDRSRLVAPKAAGADAPSSGCVLDAEWLQENAEGVKRVMGHYAHSLRFAMDSIGVYLNAGGATLGEAFGDRFLEPHVAVKSFCANLQVWGSLGSMREHLAHISNKEVELLLQKGVEQTSSEASRLSRTLATLTPDVLSSYHRQLSAPLAAEAQKMFKLHAARVIRFLEVPASPPPEDNQDDQWLSALLRAQTLEHLREVEAFLACVCHFFSGAGAPTDGDDAGVADSNTGASACDAVASTAPQSLGRPQQVPDSAPSSPSRSSKTARPAFDRALTGYLMCVECGHNGHLSEGEMAHLRLHLRSAAFGKC